MYYSNDYLCHYGVLGMKWGQHIAARSQAKSAKRAAKAQRKADIAEGKKYQTYSQKSGNKRFIGMSSVVGAIMGGIGSSATVGTVADIVGGLGAVGALPVASIALGGAAIGVVASTAIAKRTIDDMYADMGSAARRGANYATDNMKYVKQVQDTADNYGIAARVKRVN